MPCSWSVGVKWCSDSHEVRKTLWERASITKPWRVLTSASEPGPSKVPLVISLSLTTTRVNAWIIRIVTDEETGIVDASSLSSHGKARL